MRLVQINAYYSEKYEEQTLLMKYLLFTMIPLIILIVIYNKGIMPQFLFYALVALVSLIGAWFIVKTWLSIITRDNMNYQAYDWYFDPSSVTTGTTTSSGESNPWSVNVGTCVGADCCSENQTYDTVNNICVSA